MRQLVIQIFLKGFPGSSLIKLEEKQYLKSFQDNRRKVFYCRQIAAHVFFNPVLAQ